MADAKQCVDVVLRQEDATLAGTITNYADDPGGLTRLGLCARFHPELVEAGFFDESMPIDVALPLAEKTYEEQYEGPLCLDQLRQGVATALLSFAVNQGNVEAIMLMQRAVAAAGVPLVADGAIGPATVAAVNSVAPSKLAPLWGQFEEAFYRHIVEVKPSWAKFLEGALNRVAADVKLCAG